MADMKNRQDAGWPGRQCLWLALLALLVLPFEPSAFKLGAQIVTAQSH
jgi:hypothetical protein